MKTFYPILSLALPLALGLTGCAKEDIAPSTPTSPETKATVFIGGANNKVATRTSLQTDFSSTVSYFWSTGDKIYIEETSGNWLASTGAEKLDEKGASAQFTFASELTDPSYKVYFPGSAAGSQNNVTVIPAIQHQSAPGSTEGLDKNGDSGIGTATLENGVYTFKLQHQPSYLAFLPTAASSTYKLKSISLSAAEPTNGTYLLTENDSEVLALQTAGATATKVVFDYDYIVPQNMQADSAIYMVLPPGIYNNVEIAYTYEDTSTGKTSNYSKRYSRIRLNKNEIKSVNQIINPQILDYTYNATDYYAWGAQDTYPVEGEHAPENGDPSYQSTQDFPTEAPQNTRISFCPNANEIWWYIVKGDPHWDGEKEWTIDGTTYKGGLWLKKLQVLAKEHGLNINDLKERSDNNEDLRVKTSSVTKVYNMDNNHYKDVATSPLPNPADYFFLPAMGYYDHRDYPDDKTSTLREFGTDGYYWSSSAAPSGFANAYALIFNKTAINLSSPLRRIGLQVWYAL